MINISKFDITRIFKWFLMILKIQVPDVFSSFQRIHLFDLISSLQLSQCHGLWSRSVSGRVGVCVGVKVTALKTWNYVNISLLIFYGTNCIKCPNLVFSSINSHKYVYWMEKKNINLYEVNLNTHWNWLVIHVSRGTREG